MNDKRKRSAALSMATTALALGVGLDSPFGPSGLSSQNEDEPKKAKDPKESDPKRQAYLAEASQEKMKKAEAKRERRRQRNLKNS